MIGRTGSGCFVPLQGGSCGLFGVRCSVVHWEKVSFHSLGVPACVWQYQFTPWHGKFVKLWVSCRRGHFNVAEYTL